MSGGSLATKGIVSGGSGATYRMRAMDTTLARFVYWNYPAADPTGAGYTGPGPLTDIVVSIIIGQTITIPGASLPSPFNPQEVWVQQNVAASQTNVALSAQVSTNFDTIKMMRAGSITGLATRLTQAITAGTLTVVVTKNGAPGTLTIVHTFGSGSVATQASGIDTYVAGDLIGISLTTDSGFLPVTTDLEAWLEVLELLP